MVTASAPATTANLGPGFDCLGAALDIRLEVVTGGDDPFPKRIQRAIDAAAGEHVDVTGSVRSPIPQARGLGSSAACVAAGLLIGCALAGRKPDAAELLALGTPIEGHPDNLAPALFGGVTVVTPGGRVVRFAPAADVRPVVLVPSDQLKTDDARRVLPDDVARRDALRNVAWSSALTAVLAGTVPATDDLLLECTDDRLHQPQRASLMPATADAIADLRAAGIAAAVSGAGTSVVCLVRRERASEAIAAASRVEGFRVLEVDWSTDGARLT